MATTFYTIRPKVPVTTINHGDSYILIPDKPSQEMAEVEVCDCTGSFPLKRWRDKEDGFVPVGVDFIQKNVPILIQWDSELIQWNVGAMAQTINDREWLVLTANAMITGGNARLSFIEQSDMIQYCDLIAGRAASSVVIHNGRKRDIVVRFVSINSGVQVLVKGQPLDQDIVVHAGSTLELMAAKDNIYTLVSLSANSGGPGMGGTNFVYTEVSLYALVNTAYGVNSENQAVGIIFPENPTIDDTIAVMDVAGFGLTNRIWVIRHPDQPTHTVDGFDENFIIDLGWGTTHFVFDGNGNWAINPDAIGAIGDEGPQGFQGNEGLSGQDGPQGSQGTTGTQGSPGSTGPQGADGVDGPQGSQGDDGVSNVPGPQGDIGATGPQGTTGSQGADSTVPGPQGDIGAAGPQGAKGFQGAPGPQGFQGADSVVPGPQGVVGSQGPQGNDSVVPGPQGVTGSQGPQGFQGVDGSGTAPHGLTTHTDVDTTVVGDGQVLTWDLGLGQWVPKTIKSVVGVQEFAYRVTLPPSATPGTGRYSRDNADPNLATTLYLNALDLAGDDISLFLENIDALDWLNVHDDANVNNSESFDVTGPAVLNGSVYEIPVVIYLVEGVALANNQQVRVFWRINQEPVLGPQGPQGDTGAQGPQGDAGADGAQGPQGFQGDDGLDGVDGAQGATGPQGFQGNAGPQGFQGDDSVVAGPQGATGAQGPQGFQGADSTVAGPQGDTGLTGAQGAAGADSTVAGPQGDTGPQGAPSTVAGPQGADGNAGAQGVPGSDGAAGAEGPQGDAGAQGAVGAPSTVAGPQGSAGAAGPQGDVGAAGATGNTGRSVVVTENAAEPASPQPGDIWIVP